MNFDILLTAYIITTVAMITVIACLVANIILNNKKIDEIDDTVILIKDAIGMDNINDYLSLYGYLNDALNRINENIGRTNNDKTLTSQNKALQDLILKDADTEKQRFIELETRLRNITMELHNINEHRDIPKL